MSDETSDWDSLGLLWIIGAAASGIWAGTFLFASLQGERFETAQYLWTAALVPSLSLVLGLATRSRAGRIPCTALKLLFVCAFSAVVFRLASPFSPMIALLAFAQSVLIAMLARHWIIERLRERQEVKLAIFCVTVFALNFLAWSVATRAIWWRPLPQWSTQWHTIWLFVVLISFLTWWGLAPQKGVKRPMRAWDTAAVLFFALPSIRVNLDFFNTGFYVGPADLVRQGAWLLWDVPSQYGYLNILLMGSLPGLTSWQWFWVFNSLLVFLSACGTFFLFRTFAPGRRGFSIAFLATVAVIFFMPGWGPTLAGPSNYPSTGALRFFFPYALLLLVFLNLRLHGARFWSGRFLGFGAAIWMLGVLWSLESAFYCTMIWAPIVVQAAIQRIPLGLKPVLRVIALCPAVLLVTSGVISLYYRVRLGSYPDLGSYLDFAKLYQNGFGSLPVEPNGSVWILILLFCGGSSAAYLAARRAPWLLGGIAASGATLIATASYFISRSHENNVNNLLALFVFGFVLAILHVESIPELARKTWLPRSMLAPLLAIAIAQPLSDLSSIHGWMKEIFKPRGPASVHDSIERVPDALRVLLLRAGIRDDDPVVMMDCNLLGSLSSLNGHRMPSRFSSWLPLNPMNELGLLSDDRQELYIRRFMTRAPAGGWLAVPETKGQCAGQVSGVLRPILAVTHRVGAEFTGNGWTLSRYDLKP